MGETNRIELPELEQLRRKAIKAVYDAIERTCAAAPREIKSKAVLSLAQAAEALNERGVLQCQ